MLNLKQSLFTLKTTLRTPVKEYRLVYNISYESGLSKTTTVYPVYYTTNYPNASAMYYSIYYSSQNDSTGLLYKIRYTTGAELAAKNQSYFVRYTTQYTTVESQSYSLKYGSTSAETLKNRRRYLVRYTSAGSSGQSITYTIKYKVPSLIKRTIDYSLKYTSETPLRNKCSFYHLSNTAGASSLLILVDGQLNAETVLTLNYLPVVLDLDLVADKNCKIFSKDYISNQGAFPLEDSTNYVVIEDISVNDFVHLNVYDKSLGSLTASNTLFGRETTSWYEDIIVNGTVYNMYSSFQPYTFEYSLGASVTPYYKATASCCLQTKIINNSKGACSPL